MQESVSTSPATSTIRLLGAFAALGISLLFSGPASARPEYLSTGSERYLEGLDQCAECEDIASFRECMRSLAVDYASLGWYRRVEACLGTENLDEALEGIRSLGVPYADNCRACHPGETFPPDVLFPDHADIGCETCHAESRPKSHGEGFLADHGATALDRANGCAVCHDRNFCNTCHENERPAFHGEDDYEHYLDAQRNIVLCRLCHDQEVFCGTCHEPGDETVFGLRSPTPHPADHHDALNCSACHVNDVYTDFGLGTAEIPVEPDLVAGDSLPQAVWSRGENEAKWDIMWWLFGIGLAVFAFGILRHIFVWIQGGPSGEEGRFNRRTAWKAVWEDAILQGDTWRRDRTRWWAYAGIHYGFFGMLICFLIVVLVRHVFHPMVFADSAAWTWAVDRGTAPWAGLILDGVTDLFGLFAVVGILFAMGRRWVWLSPLPSDEAEDMFSLFLFLAVVVTGFMVEAAKLAPLVPEAAQWVTFVPTAAARIMGRFDVSWTGVHYYLWLIHLAITFIFLAYLPYGKLFHAITSPVSVALEAGREKGH